MLTFLSSAKIARDFYSVCTWLYVRHRSILSVNLPRYSYFTPTALAADALHREWSRRSRKIVKLIAAVRSTDSE